MTFPEISVIVPVYKAEKYIHRCIDSIIAQTFGNFELIAVNDGSPDNCGAICDEYAQTDKRVKVFHQENGGVSAARNRGLDQATAKWVTFIDSDDWVSPHYLEHFFSGGKEAGLGVSGYNLQQGDGKWNPYFPQTAFIANDGIPVFFGEHISSYLIRGPWCKLFRLETIKENGLRFDESLSFGEDQDFTIRYIACIDSIMAVNHSGYYHLSNEDSLTNTVDVKDWRLYVNAYERALDHLPEKCRLSFPVQKDLANRRLALGAVQIRDLYKRSRRNSKERYRALRELFAYLRKHHFPYLKAAEGNFHRLLSMLYYLNSVRLTDLVFSLLLKGNTSVQGRKEPGKG